MIEILKSRRYIGLCICLVTVCLIVMIMEGMFTHPKPAIAHDHNVIHVPDHPAGDKTEGGSGHHPDDSKPKEPIKTACWLHEDFHIVSKCAKCNDTGNFTACHKTGYVEALVCRTSGTHVIRSCVHKSALISFFQFEIFMTLMAGIGWYFCYRRESYLKQIAMERINKSLSGGV